GIEVMGTVASLPLVAKSTGVKTVIITITDPLRRDLKRILQVCESVPLKTRVVPAVGEFLKGNMTLERFREVDISHLLRRPPVTLDEAARQGYFANKRVMVTGAGGSIGSELARQVALLMPSKLLLVERAEFALFTISGELRAANPNLEIKNVLAD